MIVKGLTPQSSVGKGLTPRGSGLVLEGMTPSGLTPSGLFMSCRGRAATASSAPLLDQVILAATLRRNPPARAVQASLPAMPTPLRLNEADGLCRCQL